MASKLAVTPMGKPRMTRSDKWAKRPCVLRYRQYKDALRKAAHEAGYNIGEAVRVVFLVPMPPSWSKRQMERMHGQPHQVRPDVDNMIKGLLDCLLPRDDASVWKVDAEKRWAGVGAILIENIEITG